MKFIRNGNVWNMAADVSIDVRDELPQGVYTVCRNPVTGEYYLEDSEPFTLPPKLYGKTEQYTERILSAFDAVSDGHQLGVLLAGEKGSGKTMLSKNVASKSSLPVILVNAPFSDDRFMRTLQGIPQRAVVIFDEFEKLYDKEAQAKVLTLFDGVYTARNKLILLTVNDRYSVRDFFHNRPGRLRYLIEFTGLDAAFIKDYCKDNLQKPDYLEDILKTAVGCQAFNFDMLQALVRELNDYGGTVEETVEILNVKPLTNRGDAWEVEITSHDPRFKFDATANDPLSHFHRGNPYFNIRIEVEDRNSDFSGDSFASLTLEDLRLSDPYKGSHIFEKVIEFTIGEDGDNVEEIKIPVKMAFRRQDRISFYQSSWAFGGADS